jgi:catechol 2,3-dioxygenase
MTNKLIAHLAHVEILTPRLKESIWFFTDLLSMYVVKRDTSSCYLKCWGEIGSPFSLRLTQAEKPGLGHVAWRADSPGDLEEIASLLQRKDSSLGWSDRAELGRGKAFEFMSPEGHLNEVFWESASEPIPANARSKINARPMRMPNALMAVRRLDHCTFFASDVRQVREFYQTLGFKYNEGIISSVQGNESGAFLAVTGQSHDLGILRDPTGSKGRLNHVAFFSNNVGAWIEGCDAFLENGIPIEMGPMRHGITDSLGLYVIEPGGNRIEIFHGSYVNYTPMADWTPVITDIDSEAGKYGTAWGLGFLAETWLTYGTPIVEVPEETKQAIRKSREWYAKSVYGNSV